MPDDAPSLSRRTLLAAAAGAAGAIVTGREGAAQGQTPGDPTHTPGARPTTVGKRSGFEHPERLISGSAGGSSRTPLQDLDGILTPSDLHFERHHAGIPRIDPSTWSLLIHGLVDRPTVFGLDDLKRFPTVSRLHFLECSGNGGVAFYGERPPDRSPQEVDGLLSTSEWIGVPLEILFREVGVQSSATWFLAEGMDAAVMARSIPVDKAFEDAMIAFGQNGEALRPEQGYPARLLLPGWEGNANVKWIRRIELSDRPFMTRDETSKYTDPLKDGSARIFSFVMDAKSLITSPAYPERLPGRGWYQISGLAWSGRGRITGVEVSVDGGGTWEDATLQEPVLPKCTTRFRFPWRWEGDAAVLMSRATDETGYVQPPVATLRDVRGPGTRYHYNSIRAWTVRSDGRVIFGGDR